MLATAVNGPDVRGTGPIYPGLIGGGPRILGSPDVKDGPDVLAPCCALPFVLGGTFFAPVFLETTLLVFKSSDLEKQLSRGRVEAVVGIALEEGLGGRLAWSTRFEARLVAG